MQYNDVIKIYVYTGEMLPQEWINKWECEAERSVNINSISFVNLQIDELDNIAKTIYVIINKFMLYTQMKQSDLHGIYFCKIYILYR